MTSQRAAQPGERRVALMVAYDGTGYAGFQLQANSPTIQGELETAFTKLTGEAIRVRGASRTDAGAHAMGQVVDVATFTRHDVDTIAAAMNHYLPPAIRIITALEVPFQFHARRSASARTYRYSILNREIASPLLRHTHHTVPGLLDLPRMRAAARSLIGIRDFRQLSTGHPAGQSAVRQVFRWDAKTQPDQEDVILIECQATGFLRHQIRRANGILIEIAKGQLPIHAMADALAGRTQKQRQIAALPAKGLCLQSVHYPEFEHLLKGSTTP